MLFENTWNRITTWFNDRSERARLLRSFNDAARTSFVNGETPTMLRTSTSRGYTWYRHHYSSWFSSGFRIKAMSGRLLSKEEMSCIGAVILADSVLVRRMIVLGFDTLEVHDDYGRYGCRWRLTEYANIGLMLNS